MIKNTGFIVNTDLDLNLEIYILADRFWSSFLFSEP